MKDYNAIEDVKANFETVLSDLIANKKLAKSENPSAILLGGQPGAGKSHGTQEVIKELENNVIVINGDEFRKYHKHYNELYNKYGKASRLRAAVC